MLMTKQYNTNLPSKKQRLNLQPVEQPIIGKVLQVDNTDKDSEKVKLLLKNF